MDSSSILIIAWLFFSIVPILMGISMMTNKKYRNQTTDHWFRSANENDRASNRRFVGRTGGMMYVLIGLGFLAIGLFVLYGPSS
jgi:hypothetical protein